MKAFVYNVETNEIVVVIEGETNQACEAKADELNYMGVDEYGLTYTNADNSLTETEYTEFVSA